MKLLVVSHSCVTSTNQQLYAEVERLTGWDITLVVPCNWRNEYGKRVEVSRWPAFHGDVIGLPVFASGSIILHAYRSTFLPLLRSMCPDVIYVNHEPYALATAQVYYANSHTINCPIGFYSAQNILKHYPLPFKWLERWIHRQSSFAFPCSEDVESVLREKGYANASRVLPLGIDPDLYRPTSDAVALRGELRKCGSELLVGYVGRIVQEKGIRTLLRAIAVLRDLPLRLVVVGAGPFEPEFKRLVAELGIVERVHHTGFVPHTEAPRYLGAVDVLVVPSETQANWREQFGRVVIEAMACGTPVIGSDSGEIPNLIRRTGGGLVFQERSVDDLAAQIRSLASSPETRERMASRGRQVVLSQYSLAALAAAFGRLVSESVQGNRVLDGR